MSEDGEERSPERDDERAPEHRVLWEVDPEHTSSTRALPPVGRGTVKMVRRDLALTTRTARLVPYSWPATGERAGPALHGSRAVPPRPHAGVLPLDPRLVLLTDPDSPRAAGFRALRDNLLARGLPRIVGVSSAAAHEGKTTCAVNVALALAEHRAARVLLVDGNFFVPALSELFAIDEQTPAEPTPHLPWVAPFKLSALTAGLHVATLVRRRGETLPRLDRQRFSLLLGRMCRIGYDHVVVDAPSLDGSAMQLLSAVDGVLLVVRAGHTTARAVRSAVERLPRGRLLGSALMDARH